MEFDFLGERCSLPNCRRHDYLPFTCSACANVFCPEHGAPSVHQCSSLRAGAGTAATPAASSSASAALVSVPCKACGQIVSRIPASASAATKAAALRSHKRDCTETRKNAPICGAAGCKDRLVSPIVCKGCTLSFCVPHRSAARHNCTNTEYRKQERNIAVVAPSRFVPTKSKPNSAIHPYGDTTIEGHSRVYCELRLKVAGKNGTAPIYYFFHRRWTVGRALDAVSERIRIPIRSPDGRRLQLRVGDTVTPFLATIGDAVPQHATVCVEYESVVTGRAVSSGISTSPIVSIDLTRD